MDGNKFTAGLKFTKAREGDGEMYVTLTASGVKVDKQNERMAPAFIEKIQRAAGEGALGLRESHNTTFDIGRSTGAALCPTGDMDFEFKLEKKHPMAPFLFERVQKGEAKEQASLDGVSTDRSFEWDGSLKKMVKVLKDGIIKFVALTPPGESAYPSAGFVEAIVKQVPWEAEPAVPATHPEGHGGGVGMKDLLNQLQATAEAIQKHVAGSFAPTADMLEDVGGTLALKKEFKEQYEKSRVAISDDDRKAVEETIVKILGAIGNPVQTAELLEGGEPTGDTALKPAADKAEVVRKALGLDKTDAAIEKLSKTVEALTAMPVKGRPVVPGGAQKIEKSTITEEPIGTEDLTKSMKNLAEAVKLRKIAPEHQAEAGKLVDSFLKRVAADAVAQDLAADGIVPTAAE
jgi:hypothetical protein